MTTAANVDPHALIAALKAAGFVPVGHGRGHTRFAWPGGLFERTFLVVATDPTAPEFESMMTAALGELEAAAMRGDAALEVLKRVVDPIVERS